MKTAISITRVSTFSQGRDGLGISAQQASIDAFAARENINIMKRFVEVESGASSSRKVLREALDECVRTGSFLLVAKMDRFARKMSTLNMLEDYGVELVAADLGMNCSAFIKNLMCLIAQNERAMISTRTKEALAQAKARGVKLGNPRWMDGAQAKAAAAAKEANIHRGNLFFFSVVPYLMEANRNDIRRVKDYVEYLNENGSRTSRGRVWSKGTLYRFIKRAKVEGYIK